MMIRTTANILHIYNWFSENTIRTMTGKHTTIHFMTHLPIYVHVYNTSMSYIHLCIYLTTLPTSCDDNKR